MAILEYVWLDGYTKVKNLRSKCRVEPDRGDWKHWDLETIPNWGFDGSSTEQADGGNSDCILKPVLVIDNPLRSPPPGIKCHPYNESFIVFCEVMNTNGSPHESNTRAKMMETYSKYRDHKTWFAFEQEYTIYDRYGHSPFLWPQSGFPPAQGRYYCGVGSDVAWGREISDAHMEACLKAGLSIHGTNAEVMASQWEYQTGPDIAPGAADSFWVTRFILNRIAENYGLTIKLDPKPVKGDWNGAGCHTNFSTEQMRMQCPTKHWTRICEAIGRRVQEHIAVYGHANNERLTGEHETQHIEKFSYGIADRGASIRIPPQLAKSSKGYLEDRRPAANIDPYQVCDVLMETVCGAYERGEITGVRTDGREEAIIIK